MKSKIIVICGPTASGKSSLGVELALQHNGEIISADSRQIYRGLDFCSGKITQEEMSGVRHHLLDIIELGEDFSVTQYKNLAEGAVQDILSQNKTPIIVGGTGQYIQAITHNFTPPSVPPNPDLRSELEEKETEKLFELLQKKDPIRAESIDPHNKQRLIRALEIIETVGHVPPLVTHDSPYNILTIYLDRLKEELLERTRIRIESTLPFMIQEARTLHESGVSWDILENLGLWPELVALHCQNKISHPELIEYLNTKTWQYAKRQRTWFMKDDSIETFHPEHDRQKILDRVDRFLHNK